MLKPLLAARLSVCAVSAASALVLATGCNSLPGAAALPGGSASTAQAVISGKVFGGQQPIAATTIGLYAAGVTGATDGLASTSIFNNGVVVSTSDGTGLANANANAGNSNNTLPSGFFNITGDYTCPSGDPQVFLTASGGNPGISQTTNNAAIQEMLPLGNCSTLSARQNIVINEVTTVGMVAALYPYITGYNAVGATAAHASAMVSAFNTAAEYVNAGTGLAPGPALPAGYYASTNALDSLANSVASCVNTASYVSGDGGNCDKLFTYATPPSGATLNAGVKPADTATAILEIRNNPTNNVANIFNLSSAIIAFTPTLSSAPTDWSLPITAIPATPVISPYGGTYATTQSVTISDSEASLSFFYTTDGTTPTASSTAYTGAISVSAATNTTINAIAVRASGATSAVGSSSYTINTALTAPTVSLASLSATYGSTTGLTLTATSNVTGQVVTFGTAGSIGGSFSAATCTISGTTCSVTYTPSGTLAVATYTNDLTANFAASGSYGAGNATGTLTVATAYNYTQTHAFTEAIISGTVTDGGLPEYGNLVQGSDGSFYGTTKFGGASNYGTVFKISADGSTYTQLHAFTNAIISGTIKDGASPYGGLVQGSDGSFYGTTYVGGASNYGTVFKISADGSTYTQLHAFTEAIISGTVKDGGNPYAGLVQGSDGSFYGTTLQGGASNYGTVFKISADGSTYTQLHAFTEATISGTVKDGGNAVAGLVQGSDGSFYGTTSAGGASNYGTVFKISADGSTYTQLHAFTNAIISGTVKDGAQCYSGLVQGADGSFYGTTLGGGAFHGTVYKISADGSTYTQLHAFTAATIAGTSLKDGATSYAGLVQGSDGSFYGTTAAGGLSNYGTVYKISADGSTYTQLYAFTNFSISGTTGKDGATPYAGLAQGADGSFYGTTVTGGANNDGTVFKIAASPLLAAPVTLTVPASVTHGASFTLGYAVSNAASTAGVTASTRTTLQSCQYFATNSSGTQVATGPLTATTTNTNATLTAPATAGTYTYSLTCGGTETGFATLPVQ